MKQKKAIQAFELMYTAFCMTELYEERKDIAAKYVHATSRGHEAIQLAAGMQLLPTDFVFPYYRDDAMLLGIGMQPHELMLQLLAKKGDPFSGGRTYYSHPSLNDPDKPKIPHQSSATGMQAIPAAGVAMGLQYKKLSGIDSNQNALVICSLGDASCTEGEVSEAFQMAALKQLPIIFLVQDNEWDISAHAREIRAQDISKYAQGFNGLNLRTIDGTNFQESYTTVKEVIDDVRTNSTPYIIHAKVPLLNHHTSGVRKEWYRDDLEEAQLRDPLPKIEAWLTNEHNITLSAIENIKRKVNKYVHDEFDKAMAMEDPKPSDLTTHYFAPNPIKEETGNRSPENNATIRMVDCALFAIKELMQKHPECLLYGQDVGRRLGGVFREAATLAETFGDHRVFNTPIQEAFIVGSTVGMAATGLKPIVEVQFADYIWPGLNQLFTELSRSYYLSNGKWAASMVLRVPIGAYGSGGPYHSSSVESVVTNIRGIKVLYPSSGADLKGLMKSAYYDPNPVVIFEHKGLYWSKVPGTEAAMTVEPDEDYIIPIGKGRVVLSAKQTQIDKGNSIGIITYGRGVHWALEAVKNFDDNIEIVDLRTLSPLDEELIFETAKKHGKILLITEESTECSFTPSIASKIQSNCFEYLDAPISIIGSVDTPAIPLNSILEHKLLPNKDKVTEAINQLLAY